MGSGALSSVRKRLKAGEAPTFKPRSDLVKNPPFTFHYGEVALPSCAHDDVQRQADESAGQAAGRHVVSASVPGAADWHLRPQEAQEADGMFQQDDDTWIQSRLCGTFNERTGHPCQLPEALLERIVRVSSNAGDLVFDPFAGSGTTLAVAKRLGRDYLGCEMSTEYAKQVRQRLGDVKVELAGEAARA